MHEVSPKPVQTYNLVWLTPRFVTSQPEGAPVYPLFRPETTQNMLDIARRNPGVDVRIWVDSQRHSSKQLGWLEAQTAKANNLSALDLRDLREFRDTPFYSEEDQANWRADKTSLIWRQVDAARLLVCREDLGNSIDQTFYSDMDINNLTVNSPQVQKPLQKHGLIVAGIFYESFLGSSEARHAFSLENSVLGFTKNRSDFVNELYQSTVEDVTKNNQNGYYSLIVLATKRLRIAERVDLKEAIFPFKSDGTQAMHPDPIQDGSKSQTCNSPLLHGQSFPDIAWI